VGRDLVGSEQPGECLLVARLERLLPASALEPIERLVGVAVEAVLEQVDDVGVVPERPRLRGRLLRGEERRQGLIDRRSVVGCHGLRG